MDGNKRRQADGQVHLRIIIDLHRLSAACRRSDPRKKETRKRNKEQMPYIALSGEKPHEIIYNDRFAHHKHENEQNRQYHGEKRRFADKLGGFIKIAAAEHEPDRNSRDSYKDSYIYKPLF